MEKQLMQNAFYDFVTIEKKGKKNTSGEKNETKISRSMKFNKCI